MTAQRSRFAAVVLVVLALVSGLVIVGAVGATVVHHPRPSASRDPRAYPMDDGTVPLAEATRRAGLTIPACLDPVLHYAFMPDDGFQYDRELYIGFESDADCVDALLGENRFQSLLDLSSKVGGEQRPVPNPFPLSATRSYLHELGWDMLGTVPVEEFDATTARPYGVILLTHRDDSSGMITGYLFAQGGV